MFGTLLESVEHVAIHYNESRRRRSNEDLCQVPFEEVNNIVAYMKEVIDYKATPSDIGTVELPFLPSQSATECYGAKDSLLSHVSNLSAYVLIFKTKGISLSANDTDHLKLQYQQELTQLEKKISEVKSKASYEIKMKIEEIEKLNQKMSASIDELEALKKQHNKDLISLCVSEIDRGNYDTAREKFLQLGDRNKINEIINQAYSVERIEKILNFIKKLPWPSDYARGYQALAKEMKDHNHLVHEGVLTLQYLLNEALTAENKASVIVESKDLLENTTNILSEPAKNTIRYLGQQIQKGDFKLLSDYFYSRPEPFNKNIAEIIKSAYANNDESALKIIDFSVQLKNIEPSVRVILELFNQMSTAGRINFEPTLKIANEIKQNMEQRNYIHISDDLKSKFENLKDLIPSTLKVIIWNTVCIKNDFINAYLYDKGVYDDERRIVSITKSKEGHYRWRFEGIDNGDLFRVVNVDTGEYLYAASDHFAYDENKRRIFTWREKKPVYQGNWKLRDSSWRDERFNLLNTHHSEYLNAGEMQGLSQASEAIKNLLLLKVNPEASQAFTWRGKGQGPKPVWHIYAC